jgi:ABC-type dipeptide/oligopeptide/nickel transport system ATPase component
MNAAIAPLLEVDGLKTYFYTRDGVVRAVDGISFSVYPGETLAVVGESGCGKSVTALSILRLVAPPGRIVSGEIHYRGEDLLRRYGTAESAGRRGGRDLDDFQEPMTSLNPVLTSAARSPRRSRFTADSRTATLPARGKCSARQYAGAERTEQYPHQLSGGIRQRMMIQWRFACNRGS